LLWLAVKAIVSSQQLMNKDRYDSSKDICKQPIMSFAQEALKFFLLGISYWAYMIWGARLVTEGWALLVNGFVIPFLVGSVGYLIFKSQKVLRILLVTIASLFAALIAAKGGDPAKPGLHLIAIAVMTAISFLGAIATAGVFIALQKLRFQQQLHKH
jgi:hypothetical protein